MKNQEEWVSYVNHLRTEHKHLRRTVQAVDVVLRKEKVVPKDLVAPLEELADELSHHFAEEEEGGCLDEAVSVCPSLGPQVNRSKAEHAELRQAGESILQKGKASAADKGQSETAANGAISELRETFADFARRLLAHENAESEVMRQAFGVADNGDESHDDVPSSLANENP